MLIGALTLELDHFGRSWKREQVGLLHHLTNDRGAKMKRAFIICLLMTSVAFAGSQSSHLMPEGFDQIRIGMDWRSLVSLRPNAEILNMMPDPGEILKPDPQHPKSGLFEKLSGTAYSVVYYSFEDGVLVAVMFGKEKGRSTPLERENAIRRIGQGRGEPIKIQLTGKRHDQGVLTWQDQTLHINVMHQLATRYDRKRIGLQDMKFEVRGADQGRLVFPTMLRRTKSTERRQATTRNTQVRNQNTSIREGQQSDKKLTVLVSFRILR